MRAGRFVEYGKLVCEDAEVRQPNDGELLVRSAFGSICGSDLHSVFPASRRVRAPGPPGYPGHEGVGEVIESRHPDYTAGERVLCVPPFQAGMCFAEIQTINARYAIKLPDTDVALEHMLMAQQLGTVVWALKRRPFPVEGRNVVVLGQGSAGVFFAFLLKRAGAARVVVTDLSAARLDYSKHLGVDAAIDASQTEDVPAAVREATGGRGGDVVVEAIGIQETLMQSMAVAAPSGDLVWFGLPDGRDPAPFSFSQFFGKRLSAYSAVGAQEEPGHDSFRTALDLIVKREIDVGPLVSHVLPIEEIGRAFELAYTRDDKALKVSVSF